MNWFVAAILALACLIELEKGLFWEKPRLRVAAESSRRTKPLSWAQNDSGPIQLNFTQTLDHFNKSNNLTWLQRYWIDDSNFNGTGPVFLVLSEAARASPSLITDQQIAKTAKTFQALIVLVEHRFFGDSIPNGDLSIDNLKFLTIRQALEDVVSIRNYIHRSFGLTNANKWVAFGLSYGGSLAAWFRLKYPNLVNGAVAVSAQINARFDASYFFQNSAGIMNDFDPECAQAVKNATYQMFQLIYSKKSSVESLFGTCSPLLTGLDIKLLSYQTSYYFSFSAEYYNTNILPNNLNLASACQVMTNATIGNELTRYAKYIGSLISYFGYPCLLTSYDMLVTQVRNVNDLVSGFRASMYFYCTQLGVFPSSLSGSHPFGHDVSMQFWISFCNDAFDFRYSIFSIKAAMDRTNAIYGGLNYAGSSAIFVSGSLDPWRNIYITKDSNLINRNPNIEIIEIEGVSTFYDFTSIDQTAEVTYAINRINELISGFISS